MERSSDLLLLLLFFLLFCSTIIGHRVGANETGTTPVGFVFDLDTSAGKRSWTSISMAIEDFYIANSNHKTRVVLHTRDSNQDTVGAASAALDLLQKAHVLAIIGAGTSAQTEFLIGIGNKTQVPVISFTATSPTLVSSHMPYFIRTTMNSSSQVASIAAIVNYFGWRQVVPIYEDTDDGRSIVPYLFDALQGIGVRITYRRAIPLTVSDDQITDELKKILTMQTTVFVVHMAPVLGSRIFAKAVKLGLMSHGYVWIVTDSMADTLSLLDESTVETMQGVLSVGPYIPKSNGDFAARWKKRFEMENPGVNSVEPTAFELRAYDTATALAMAVEKVGVIHIPRNANNSKDLASLIVSSYGPKLLKAIKKSRFHGVAGEFQLVNGQLQSSAFQIMNIVGKSSRLIGFWTAARGLSRQLDSSTIKSEINLEPIIWPGITTSVPKGLQMPTNQKKLRIGVPRKNGFSEFVNVEWDSKKNISTITGFCIDVFEAVIQMMPYPVPYEYIPLDDASLEYHDPFHLEVYLKELDAVVGDVTILADRSLYVDFTLPYMDSGVSFLVPIKDRHSKNPWVFLKPLTTKLWLWSLFFFIFTGFVVWVLERRINDEFRGTPSEQMGHVYYFAFSTLFFAHKDRLVSKLSMVVVIIWVFVVLILTSSYMASLTSLLTVQQFKPIVADVEELVKNGDYVGYHGGSFVLKILQQMKFPKSKLKNLNTLEEYADALSKGSSKGGVAAIFDEIPYLKLLLSKHCGEYTFVGETYRTDGFGFAFQRGSPLISDISTAVLNVTEGNIMTEITRKWFGDLSGCPSKSNSDSIRLDARNFGGLFIVTSSVSSFALILFFAEFFYRERKELSAAGEASAGSLRKRLIAWARYFYSKDMKYMEEESEAEEDVVVRDVNENEPTVAAMDDDRSQSLHSNSSDVNLVPLDEGVSSTVPRTRGMQRRQDEAASSIEMTVQ